MTPMILTHGWKDHRGAWDGVVDELTPDRPCTTWDLPYHGDAGPLDHPERPARAELVARLDTVVDSVGSPVVLAGHSLGGYLSLAYALDHPDRVAALVLVATGPGFARDEPREAWNQWAHDNADPDVPGQELVVLQHDSRVLDRLEEIGVPTLVLQGSRDTQYDRARAVFETRLPIVEAEVIEGGGHNVHRKNAAEVSAAIAEFLDRHQR